MEFRNYLEQLGRWPSSGRHILAQFDSNSIVVYQAYRPSIADFAVENHRFGGEFSFNRMSWIKPNFLWMMYRSGWAAKEDQERILAIRLRRSFFDELLSAVVPSSFNADRYPDRKAWQAALARSDVRLQWDPDHDPSGASVQRRAVQLGLRGQMLWRFATSELISIVDLTDFVVEQRRHTSGDLSRLVTPTEQVYVPGDRAAAAIAELDVHDKDGE
jgi:hypothetical protein